MQYAIKIPSLITRKEEKKIASGLINRHFSPMAQHAHCDRNASDQRRRKYYVANTLTHLGGKRPHLRIRYPHRNRPTLSSMKAALPATLSFDPNWGFRRPTAKTRSRKVAQSTRAAERRRHCQKQSSQPYLSRSSQSQVLPIISHRDSAQPRTVKKRKTRKKSWQLWPVQTRPLNIHQQRSLYSSRPHTETWRRRRNGRLRLKNPQP